MIGESTLQSVAADIENLLKDGEAVSEDKMKSLKTELMQVLEELKPLLDESATQSKVELNAEQISALIEKIEPMLKNINPEVVNLLDDIRAIPGAEKLVCQIEDYDFEAAAQTLSELKEGMDYE
jgi:ElaB/YqjD/DUF883 family membrane-anchored ribosome-binding protein